MSISIHRVEEKGDGLLQRILEILNVVYFFDWEIYLDLKRIY